MYWSVWTENSRIVRGKSFEFSHRDCLICFFFFIKISNSCITFCIIYIYTHIVYTWIQISRSAHSKRPLKYLKHSSRNRNSVAKRNNDSFAKRLCTRQGNRVWKNKGEKEKNTDTSQRGDFAACTRNTAGNY